MGYNAFVDVAIGVILMYLLLSLICTVVNEFIASGLRLRATTLASGVEGLIDDPTLKAAFDNHGLIDGARSAAGGSEPSYLSGRTFAMALLGSLDPTKPVPAFADLEGAIRHLPDCNIRDTLLSHVTVSGGDIEKLRDHVATWFDHAMDRVGGVYKRYLKLISLAVGLALALLVNADSIIVARTLWVDGTLRAQMVQASQGFSGTGATQGGTIQSQIRDLETALRPLPLGWDFSPLASTGASQFLSYWAARIFGLLITALALSLGAPFWFDLLGKFVNIRGTGAKPRRTEDSDS